MDLNSFNREEREADDLRRYRLNLLRHEQAISGLVSEIDRRKPMLERDGAPEAAESLESARIHLCLAALALCSVQASV